MTYFLVQKLQIASGFVTNEMANVRGRNKHSNREQFIFLYDAVECIVHSGGKQIKIRTDKKPLPTDELIDAECSV